MIRSADSYYWLIQLGIQVWQWPLDNLYTPIIVIAYENPIISIYNNIQHS